MQLGAALGMLRTRTTKGNRMSAYEALKGEIRRLARKEAKALIDGAMKSARGNRKQVADLKQDVAALKREVASLKRLTNGLAKEAPSMAKAGTTRERITAKGIASMRARVGLSQGELGQICGVSSGAVSHWEAQRSHPKGEALAVLVGLRRLGKKDVMRRLEQLQR